MIGIQLSAGDLQIAATRYERQVDDILDDDDELADYAQQILLSSVDDEDEDEMAESSFDLEDVDGDALIEDLENFLRDQP